MSNLEQSDKQYKARSIAAFVMALASLLSLILGNINHLVLALILSIIALFLTTTVTKQEEHRLAHAAKTISLIVLILSVIMIAGGVIFHSLGFGMRHTRMQNLVTIRNPMMMRQRFWF